MSVLKLGVSVIPTSMGRRSGGLACKGGVHEADDDRIVVSQTFPPLNQSCLNEQLRLHIDAKPFIVRVRMSRFSSDQNIASETSTMIPFINFT